MKTEQITIASPDFVPERSVFSFEPDLVLFFGVKDLFLSDSIIKEFQNLFPDAVCFGCTSAGEISGSDVLDDSLVVSGVKFDSTRFVSHSIAFHEANDSFTVGEELVKLFPEEDLRHIMVLSDGLYINGANLVAGIQSLLPENISVTGGLAGDGVSFENTFVLDEKGKPQQRIVSALGFYGKNLRVGFGSRGGWDSFGIERLVTRSKDNVLYELDDQPALRLYKQFLGEKAGELPGAGLLFPLCLRESEGQEPVVRTILGVNEDEQSLIFAGNIPQGAYARLMKANFDRLISGAEEAAVISSELVGKGDAELAILISCVGRKLVLRQLVEEEVDAVSQIIGAKTSMIGFYSYGEIAPFGPQMPCVLHNQTMTVTTFTEK